MKHKFTICAVIDFDIELPTSTYFKDEEWPHIYRKGVEELLSKMYESRSKVTVSLVPKGIN